MDTNVDKYLGLDKISVSEAMQKIDKNSTGILFLVDEYEKLVGCLSDGDIRRYLLRGGGMNDLAIHAANPKPKTAMSFEEAKKIYHQRNTVAVPVLNENGKVLAIYIEEDIPKLRKALRVPVVINAGGRGTRLDPYTKVLPKPLIPVGDLPIIEHIMKEYLTYACDDFHIIVNYKRDLMKAYFSDSENHYNITWYDEKKPLGTGGGLSLLKGVFHDTFFFANCDSLLVANYEKMLDFHKKNGNAITMICVYKNINIPYGVVDIAENGIITNMREKPLISFLTNAGVYIVEPEVVDDIEDGVPIGFPDIIEMERKKGRKTAVFPVSENDWMDMGQLPELERMRIKLYGE